MSSARNQPDNDQLDRFLDGLLDQVAEQRFLESAARSPQLTREQTLQANIDNALVRLFSFDAPLNDLAVETSETFLTPKKSIDRRQILRIMLAASLSAVAIFVSWSVLVNRGAKTHFAWVPLDQLYRSTVDRGFEPYYECHDLERFAATFEQRQGRRLNLLDLPPDRKMLGLSYLGGISRDTTAMLAESKGAKVLVLVDRQGVDDRSMHDIDDKTLNLFRSEVGGLVIYEISPLPNPQFLDFLVPASQGGTK